jgi:hypothetical protein
MSRRRPDTLQLRARRLARRVKLTASELSRPRELRALRADARSRVREAGELAHSLASLESAGVRSALIVSVSNDPESVMLEALVAKALQVRGSRVTVLMFRSAPQARRLFRSLGVERLVFYEDHEGRHVEGRLDAQVDECRTVQDFKQLTYQGARIGRHALSTVVRSRHDPRVDLDDPGIRAAIKHTINHAATAVHTGEAVLDAVRPDVLLMIERGYAGFGSIFDVALRRGIPVVQFQAAHRDDAFQVKRYTIENRDDHPRSLDESTWWRLSDEGLTLERQAQLANELEQREEAKWFMARRVRHAKSRVSDDQLRAQLGLDASRKVAVLFSHVLWDASMFYGVDVFPDQGAWFSRTVELAAADDRVQWLVKLHPALYWKLRQSGVADEPTELTMIREAVGELPDHMRLILPDDDVHNADLFRIIDAGVTIRGTVGLELPQLGVPVLTAGTSDYAGRGFTVDAGSVGEYERNVRAIADLGRLDDDAVARARLYAYGVFCLRPWVFRSFTVAYPEPEKAGDTLLHRVHWHVNTLDELRAARDFGAFAQWVLESDEPDYVAETDRVEVPM